MLEVEENEDEGKRKGNLGKMAPPSCGRQAKNKSPQSWQDCFFFQLGAHRQGDNPKLWEMEGKYKEDIIVLKTSKKRVLQFIFQFKFSENSE